MRVWATRLIINLLLTPGVLVLSSRKSQTDPRQNRIYLKGEARLEGDH